MVEKRTNKEISWRWVGRSLIMAAMRVQKSSKSTVYIVYCVYIMIIQVWRWVSLPHAQRSYALRVEQNGTFVLEFPR